MRKNENDYDLMCSCQTCFKIQCRRHRSKHCQDDAPNLNPYDHTRCEYYLSEYEVPKGPKPSIGELNGRKGGVLSNERSGNKIDD